jgi:ABC-type glycerol-3-phosphate transport system substrate-binding protein
MQQKTIFILSFIFFIILPFFSGCGFKETPPAQVEPLVIWGIWDTSDVMGALIEKYQAQNPNVSSITYKKLQYSEYEDELIKAFSLGQGPDIFLIHHTWLPKYYQYMTNMEEARAVYNEAIDSMGGCSKPAKYETPLISVSDYRNAFVDVVYNDFVYNNQIYGIPQSIDTLALYYNEDLLNEMGMPYAPTTWEEVMLASERLTKLDENGNIIQSGISLGTARNINRSGDILAMLMMQRGTPLIDGEEVKINTRVRKDGSSQMINPGYEAFGYYSSFADASLEHYTWNANLHNSIDAFQEGQVAMMINYTFAIEEIKAKAPKLNFKVAEIPQFKNASPSNKITYPSYWGYVVSRQTLNRKKNIPIEAWKFLRYLGSQEGNQLYTELTKTPSARRDVIVTQKDIPDLGIFAEQALKARGWNQPDEQKVNEIFEKNIQAVYLNNKTIEEALSDMETELKVLMGGY